MAYYERLREFFVIYYVGIVYWCSRTEFILKRQKWKLELIRQNCLSLCGGVLFYLNFFFKLFSQHVCWDMYIFFGVAKIVVVKKRGIEIQNLISWVSDFFHVGFFLIKINLFQLIGFILVQRLYLQKENNGKIIFSWMDELFQLYLFFRNQKTLVHQIKLVLARQNVYWNKRGWQLLFNFFFNVFLFFPILFENDDIRKYVIAKRLELGHQQQKIVRNESLQLEEVFFQNRFYFDLIVYLVGLSVEKLVMKSIAFHLNQFIVMTFQGCELFQRILLRYIQIDIYTHTHIYIFQCINVLSFCAFPQRVGEWMQMLSVREFQGRDVLLDEWCIRLGTSCEIAGCRFQLF
eukprot:TRINITY_DN7355_c0_g1_i8.p2 TRINITY_DN7355_c0_g1~~TRINITY_DN7355_c0_g1_i8.p2  ORF type:complete len:347 (+),score=9.42 TRINITY_DN7355_c0_g1_i8:438-1478(+)